MSDIKEEITEKLMALFINEPENFPKIYLILTEDENKFGEASPLWRGLKIANNKPEMFAKLANAIVDGITKINEEKYQEMMESIEALLLESNEANSIEIIEEANNNILQGRRDEIELEDLDELPVDDLQEILGDTKEGTEENAEDESEEEMKTRKIQKALINAKKRNDVVELYGIPGMAAAWALARGSLQSQVAQTFFGIAKNNYFNIFSSADEVVGWIGSSSAAAITMGAVGAAIFSYKTYINISRWYKGEISGERCTKKIVDNFFEVVGSFAGGIVGGMLLGGLGPFGVAIGGVAGGIAGAKAAKMLSQLLTERFFGLPKDEALENAYRFLGVNLNATNHEINQAFRKQCLKHHPDKGGKPEDFLFVKMNMQLIRQSKGYQIDELKESKEPKAIEFNGSTF